MAAALKYWRESASLILASKRLSAVKPKQSFMNRMLGKKEIESSVAPEEMDILRLLFVRRSGGSAYMPNVYVFPGGMVDDTDFSKDWLNIFQYNSGQELQNLFTHGKPGAQIFSRSRDPEFSFVPSELALRITAIRETFEESGLLVARHCDDLRRDGTHKLGEPQQAQVFDIPDKELAKWRKKVVEEPSQFMKMCEELDAVPDVWSLYEWSNWLTPHLTKTHRFDTAFFVSCIDEAPLVPEGSKGEIDHGAWANPARLLDAAAHSVVSLAPPQIYEMSRLVRFASVDDLLALACLRAKHRSHRWMPVIQPCKDGLLFLLPGDELYPEEPDYNGEDEIGLIEREESFDELAAKYPQKNRAIINYESKQISLSCNLEYVDGHVLPRDFNMNPSIDMFTSSEKPPSS